MDTRGLASERVAVLGRVSRFEADEQLKESYISHHPQAWSYINFADFSFFELIPERIRNIAGFVRMGWMDSEDYTQAEPDLLTLARRGIVEHMNEDHQENLIDYARVQGGRRWVTGAEMTGIDRLGVDLHVWEIPADTQKNDESAREEWFRIPFETALKSAREARMVLVEMAKDAREHLGEQ